LSPIIRGRMKSLEASIEPADYPVPEHDRQRLVVACGMGVDSWAMLVEMHNRGIRPDCIQWADTGSERGHTYRCFNILQQWCKRVGFPPIVIVRRRCPVAGHRSLFEQMWNNETMPSPAFHMNHSCSIEWKLKPQRAYHKLLPWLAPYRTAIGFDVNEVDGRRGTRIIEAIGIEANEAGKRRSMRYAVDNDTEYEQWYPLVEWNMTRQDCIDTIRAAGLPSPGKSACFMCPVCTLPELRTMTADELVPSLDLERRFQDGHNFRGKYVGLQSDRTWAEWLDSDERAEPKVGLTPDAWPAIAAAEDHAA
jgi:hypothetical protein